MKTKLRTFLASLLISTLLVGTAWSGQVLTDDIKQWAHTALSQEQMLTTAEIPENSVAILYFQNLSGNQHLNPLQKGLTLMLITDLSQSRYINIVTGADLSSIMDKMGVSEDQPIDASTAVSIAERARLETALVGSFIKIGETIRIDCHLYDTQSGKLLKADRVEGQGLEKVFTLVDELTRQVRDGLKLTLKGVVEFDKGLADVTTTSIDAYRYYAEGLVLKEKLFFADAAEQFERAVEVDTTFATAYLQLARQYINMSRVDDAKRITEIAMRFSDHVTEKDDLYNAFSAYCRERHIPLISKESFGRNLKNSPSLHIGMTRISDNGHRPYAWKHNPG